MNWENDDITSVNDEWREFRRELNRLNVTLEISAVTPVLRKTIEEANPEVRNARTHRR